MFKNIGLTYSKNKSGKIIMLILFNLIVIVAVF